ncbi:MAG: glycosyltransferase family 39 protein [Muribaculaceae bacterium]|nr:glycosyltransferase family 39 protein [Muribaculaceae bacterium]
MKSAINLLPCSGYKNRLLQYRTIYLFIIFLAALCFAGWPHGVDYCDTPSYVMAMDAYRAFTVDDCRPPLFPCLMIGCEWLLGPQWGRSLLVLLQWLLFVASVHFFRSSAAVVIRHRPRFVFWATAAYAFYPGIWQWCIMMQSESVGISLSVIFCWLALSLMVRPRASAVVWMALCLLLMIMTRPIFLVLVPMSVLVLLFSWKRHSRRRRVIVRWGTASVATLCMCVGGYWLAVHRVTGLRSLSAVNAYNNYFQARVAGLVEPVENPQSAIDSIIACRVDTLRVVDPERGAHIVSVWGEIVDMYDNVPLRQLEDYSSELIAAHPVEMLRYNYRKFQYQLPRYPLVRAVKMYYLNNPLVNMFMPFDLKDCAYMLIVIMFAGLWQWRRRGLFPAATFWLWGCCTLLYLAVVFGAMNDYTRLFAPAFPMLLLLLFQCGSMFRLRPDAKYV